ncbi:hypothetical protein [Treponema socranskii]
MKKALFFNRLYDNLDAGELDVKAGRLTDAMMRNYKILIRRVTARTYRFG